MKNPKVSVVIPVYKPELAVFNELKEMLGKQTVKVELIEKWNNPEAVSMNLGIREAKGDIIVILAQDCVPSDEKYIENLIKPLEDPGVSASISDLQVKKSYWDKRPFLARMLTIKDLKRRKPRMNLSSCAYRKKDLEKTGLIDEKVSAIDLDFYFKIIKLGKIENSGVLVYHLHPHRDNRKALKTFYDYYRFNGISIRERGLKDPSFMQKIVRAIPFLGLIPIYYVYPLKKYSYLLPLHLLFGGIMDHIINVFGFWHGFFGGDDEGSRNKEVLNTR